MSIQSAVARVETIRQELADPAVLIAARQTAAGGTAAPAGARATSPTAFAAALSAAGAPYMDPARPAGGSGAGARIVAAAEGQLGQSEQPPGSNESPAIAEYRGACAGATPGAPWCAYFASWAARQAGEPIGPTGEGLGSVSEIWSWAQSTGRAVANGPGVTPQPGDLIVFGGEHVGIVRGVLPDGRISTIEGNFGNAVSANVRSATDATGYVRMS
jgi:CHAP domain